LAISSSADQTECPSQTSSQKLLPWTGGVDRHRHIFHSRAEEALTSLFAKRV